jgi:alkylation response protein AidB-like acyl-CoA dehydrogenase
MTVAWCLAADVAGWSPPLGTGMSLQRAGSSYLLSGRAAFVRDVDQADALLVTVAAPGGLATVWVDPGSPRVRMRAQRTLDVTRRFGTVEISSLEVATSAVTAAGAGPLGVPLTVLNLAGVLIAADCLGGCAAVLDAAVRYSKERVTFGRVIGSYQAIKHKLADMLVALETARVSVQHASRCVAEQPPEAAARAVSIAKAHACEAYSYLAGESLQIHGGIGFAWEHDCHLYIRRARTNEALYGTPAWHFRQLAAPVP